ncbi:MAG TPA: VOC family protein [Pirellulales bacterium]|nr:VOC family protein [Pirellulales bacterium]
MERALGIGGFFFRATDPDALSQWYLKHFGILPVPTSYGQPAWQQEAGETVFAPFPLDTKYFGNAKQSWMINFRVQNLDAMIAQLRAAGIDVEVDQEEYPNGRFARLSDPEDNPIQIWEPK